MRTTTLALLSGAAMSISAASIYNVTPAGGFGSADMHASLEPLAPRSWPQLEPAGEPVGAAISTAAPTASPSAFAPPAQTAVAATATAIAFDPPVAVAIATAEPRAERSEPRFVTTQRPSTKSTSGWRARNPKPPPEAPRSEMLQQRVVVVRQEPQPQMARPMSTSSFQSAPASSVAAPASTSRPMSSAF